MARKNKGALSNKKTTWSRDTPRWTKKTEVGKIIRFNRSTVSTFFKRLDQQENTEKKPRTDPPRSTRNQGERSLISLVKHNRKRSLHDLLKGSNLSVPDLICIKSI